MCLRRQSSLGTKNYTLILHDSGLSISQTNPKIIEGTAVAWWTLNKVLKVQKET